MGDQQVRLPRDRKDMQRFIKGILEDVRSMEYMMEKGWFEEDVRRIGAEQEMVMIDRTSFKPVMIAEEILEMCVDLPWLESELARFNLEITLSPQAFSGNCLRLLEQEICTRLDTLKKILKEKDAALLLVGILPTLRKSHMTLENLTPKERYLGLMNAINSQLRGSQYELHIEGIDELRINHDSPILEAVNTSFQVHLQVSPGEFVQMYNIAQALAGPIMAIAANSPLVFGRRLWHETRIAMFQQSIDTRSSQGHLRERTARVTFGNDWLQESILEIYRDDITRHRVLMSADIAEESMAIVQRGEVPKLKALQVHNSTVYRWNRPCYGISENGKPHLRIENRVLPAGPTVIDEVSNAAMWLGLMMAFKEEYGDIKNHLSFDDVRDNFVKAARDGIDSTFNWFDESKVGARDLTLQLIDLARQGLSSQGVDQADIDRYLGTIKARAEKHRTGARWQLRSYTELKKKADQEEALSIITAYTLKQQEAENPVHNWDDATLHDAPQYRPVNLLVEECMNTDPLTVQPDDLIELVAEMMTWKKSRYVLVEDQQSHLKGIITHQQIVKQLLNQKKTDMVVSEVMIPDPVSVSPQATIKEAMQLMKGSLVNCLPVVSKQGELLGVINESDFLRISSRLIARLEELVKKKP